MTDDIPIRPPARNEIHSTKSPHGDLGKATSAAKPLKDRAGRTKGKTAKAQRRKPKPKRTVIYSPLGRGLATPLAAPLRDNWAFHDFLTLSPQHKDLVKQVLLPKLLEGEKRKRRRRLAWAETALLEICAVLANAMKAHEFAPSKQVYYSRDNNTYSDDKKELYYPSFMGTKSLGRVLDCMIAGGWLDGEKAPSKKYPPKLQKKRRKGRRSTFQATGKLLKALSELGISHADAVESDGAPLLILKNKKRERIPYDIDEKKGMRETVHEVNQFLAKQDLRWPKRNVADLRQDTETLRDREEDEVYDPDRCRLYRVFNNSDWHQNGRFYGGGWQPLSKQQRSRIRINGEPTVELDYQGFLVRAAYHSKGLTLKGDPYLVPAIEDMARKNGDQWIDIRPDVKRATQAIIYAKRHRQLASSEKLPFPDYLELGTALALIEDHHHPIADRFGGAGMFLTYREACICEQVLIAGVQAGIPILSIHDSYIVARRHQEWLWGQMIECYRKEFDGFEPVVSPETEAPAASTEDCSLVVSPTSNTVIYKNRKSDRSELSDGEREGLDPGEEVPLAALQEAGRDLERALEERLKFAAFLGDARSSHPPIAPVPPPDEDRETKDFGPRDRQIRGIPDFEAALKAWTKPA